MGKGRRRAGPRVKYVQPGYRHRAPAAPPSPDERATIIAVIDAITTKARLRLITGGAS